MSALCLFVAPVGALVLAVGAGAGACHFYKQSAKAKTAAEKMVVVGAKLTNVKKQLSVLRRGVDEVRV